MSQDHALAARLSNSTISDAATLHSRGPSTTSAHLMIHVDTLLPTDTGDNGLKVTERLTMPQDAVNGELNKLPGLGKSKHEDNQVLQGMGLDATGKQVDSQKLEALPCSVGVDEDINSSRAAAFNLVVDATTSAIDNPTMGLAAIEAIAPDNIYTDGTRDKKRTFSNSNESYTDRTSRTSDYVRQMIIHPVQNPEVFPIERIGVIQSLFYPSAKITSMRVFRTKLGSDIMATASMESGPFNRILITDSRLIAALGLDKEPHNTLVLQPSKFRMHETFDILPLSNHDPDDMENSLLGELVPARHAFLHWLDSREVADPKRPPFPQEVKRLAGSLNRRAPDVWREIEEYWDLEQGAGGKRFRAHRKKYLGEDPKYPDGQEKKPVYGMW